MSDHRSPAPVSIGQRRSRRPHFRPASLIHRLAWRTAAVLPIVVVAIATISLASPARVGATVAPATATITIPAGGTAVEEKTVGVPTLPPKADILIAIDTTGSMGTSIDQAQADANAIVTGVKESVSNSQFAVVQFKDFGDTPEYAVVRSMTSDASLVSAAINALSPGGGGDAPEAHNLVFRNSYTPDTGGDIGWRTGTKKIVVVISDASPHGAGSSGTLAGCTDTSADPNVPPLNTVTELAGMAAANRTLFMIHQASTSTTSLACYESIAAATGGDAVDVGTALGSQIVTLINAAFTAATDVHMEVASAPPSASAAWISFDPTSRPNVATPGSTTFDVQVTVPVGTPAGAYEFDLVALADGADIGHQKLTVLVPLPSLIRAVSVDGSTAHLIGRIDSSSNASVTLKAFSAASCTNGALAGGGTAADSPVAVTTDADGYFGATFTGVNAGAFVAVEVTAPFQTDRSTCIVSSGDNDFWPKALDLGTSQTASDYIDAEGRARWYKFAVTPGQRIEVSLSGLAADYDLAVFKDIEAEFLEQLTPTDADDLTKLSAEYAPSVFSPSVFSPSVFSPSVFSPDAYAPSVFSPSVFSPSVFSPSVFSPSVFSPSVFSPSVFSPSVFSPSVFSPSVFSDADLARAFSSAQTRTIIGVSATPGTGDETSVVNTWNNTGNFYVRVGGHAGAFSTDAQFTIDVVKGATTCGTVDELPPFSRPASATTGKSTVILTDSSKVALDAALPGGGTLRAKLEALAARPEVAGVLVDVDSDSRVTTLKTQAAAAANRACPYAMNLVAEEIKTIVDSYRTVGNPDLRYVVIVGGDTAIPFFRYPDQSLLGQESGYVPPVKSDSVSEASLRRDFVLSQDAYGSGVDISLRTSDFPVPGLAVGRLVETPAEVAGMLDAYTDAGGVVAPKKSLVTGYDFLEDAANEVNTQLVAGTGSGLGTVHDTLITPNETSPQDPTSWTAAQLNQKLLASRHDIMFLAGHFSANSALAADFQTSLITTDLAAAPAGHFKNAIVVSAGCHSGYNLIDDEALPGVALPLDWTQAFAQEQATLVAGTGYQYGDTDFIEYSERLYLDFARELRAGTGPVKIGEALAKAKLTYLATTPDIRGIHEKALLEATLFGLPMLGVDMIKGDTPGTGPTINPVEQPAVNGTDLGLAIHDLPQLTPTTAKSLTLKDLSGGADITANWLSGASGVVSNPAEPALPLAAVNVTSNDPSQVLRGVGFRGGTYADSGPIVPLTGAPTTELRGVHVPFTSPVFYPMRLWTPNYFGALAGTGGTSLLVTPAQHKADPSNPGKSIRRSFSDLDLRLFYSSNLTAAALSDAPTIVGVDAQPNGTGIDFTIQVVGDPNAFIHSVWITHTNGTGTWAPLDLVQSSIDTSLWTGSLASAANVKFVVQAANGLGLVSFDDNRGVYYSAAGGVQAGTTLNLLSPPSSGVFGDSPVVTAELKSAGSPLVGKSVTITIGGSSATGTTGSDGRFSPNISLNTTPTAPGSTQISASFGGDAAYGPSSDRHTPFTISKATSSLSAFTSQFTAVTAGGRSGITTVLSASVGGKTQTLGSETVTFTLSGPASRTYSTITDYLGRATLPTTGLAAGSYTVAASFAGNATYTNASRGSGTLVVSAFTGFFSPVDNPPTLNGASAGSTIPVKFSLGGNRGLAILAPGYPAATKITCQTGAPVDAIEETSSSNSGLVYDATADRYHYNWKTLKSYGGACYRLDLRLVDGSTYTANFKFK